VAKELKERVKKRESKKKRGRSGRRGWDCRVQEKVVKREGKGGGMKR